MAVPMNLKTGNRKIVRVAVTYEDGTKQEFAGEGSLVAKSGVTQEVEHYVDGKKEPKVTASAIDILSLSMRLQAEPKDDPGDAQSDWKPPAADAAATTMPLAH